jgi:methanogenic corrinoid protein MtbC1
MDETIKGAFIEMKKEQAENLVKKKIEENVNPLTILGECREAMEEVGKRFEKGEFFLGELIYSAEIFKSVSTLIEPYLRSSRGMEKSKGVVVFGTPKGDIHDLGKNIVITMMRAHGFTVVDLGVDVAPEKFIDKLRETGGNILAMSTLITPSFASMRQVIDLLKKNGLRQKSFVIIGGGVTTDLVRERVGADAQTLDPAHAIRLCSEYLERNGRPS